MTIIKLETNIEGGTNFTFNYNGVPDECPICHRGIDSRIIKAYCDGTIAQVLFQCPREKCHSIFIGYYRSNGIDPIFDFEIVLPITPLQRNFSKEIKTLSPNFTDIYNEAKMAEEYHLLQICGCGYRKALEFLIKDYVISKITDKAKIEEIKTKFLGKVINEEIEDMRIKDSSNRAAWLGNDETHYLRKWEDKDLRHLKELIEITLHWIEFEIRTDVYKKEMPEGK